ncbi:hypothetical protein DIT72_08210 [Marinobacter orientalis]|uniref:Uncharacterized protein n=1 Tax=Marinobacter orientalis TaxID=1928859 RepID=A0A7Y0RBS4_9GAMM|nr:hypothetical protein [Marinobacter orientalis]TGX52097.1 hypothetical protein DIT72_08210 [Marinobacter orientalis]
MVVYGCAGLLLAIAPAAIADEDLGVTMRMVTDDDNLTESVVREIELNDPVALERRGGESGKPADSPAAAGGADNALEVQDRGREAARAATERAGEVRERNEQRSRPERPQRPDASERPERPDLPERPERP